MIRKANKDYNQIQVFKATPEFSLQVGAGWDTPGIFVPLVPVLLFGAQFFCWVSALPTLAVSLSLGKTGHMLMKPLISRMFQETQAVSKEPRGPPAFLARDNT